ncbi:hypothetical protein ABNB56_07085 [Streptococcus iniae]|uniref:hypothetical protein n=1 Tax=Streptococcus iniae TaxID=1346 RepID=UPI0016054C5D|nr:hypothetical protein [Streptococcus iniae]
MEELTLSPAGLTILFVISILILIALLKSNTNIYVDFQVEDTTEKDPAYLSRYGRVIQM